MAMNSLAEYRIGNLVIVNAPTYVDSRALATNVAETIDVPTGAVWVRLASDETFYAKYGSAPTATVPVDAADGTASECNPEWRYVGDIAKISVITLATIAKVTAAFYVR